MCIYGGYWLLEVKRHPTSVSVRDRLMQRVFAELELRCVVKQHLALCNSPLMMLTVTVCRPMTKTDVQ